MSITDRKNIGEEFSEKADDGNHKSVNKPKIAVKMPKTANGNPRFPSRSDGNEAGVVTGGYNARLELA